MERHGGAWLKRADDWTTRASILVSIVVTAAVAFPAVVAGYPSPELQENRTPSAVMLILRGIASPEYPRGQLDDDSALEYARRIGYQGDVLDAAGNNRPESPQIKMAFERIRHDERVAAIYGFSGGGYSARRIWRKLNGAERRRIAKIVVVGSPGVHESDFVGSAEVLIKEDPPEGHMAGPKALLESVIHPERGLSASRPLQTN
jgi:hypothetical protein